MNDTENERKFIFQEILKSILPTFYVQLFRAKVTHAAFFVYFLAQEKTSLKMLVKLTPSNLYCLQSRKCSIRSFNFSNSKVTKAMNNFRKLLSVNYLQFCSLRMQFYSIKCFKFDQFDLHFSFMKA
jgi:hypothetical protein